MSSLGRVDIVLANAGIVRLGDGGDPAAVWGDIIGTNLTGTWNTISIALSALRAGGAGGCIVITSSTAGLRASPGSGIGQIAYTAAKTGLVGLMRQLAVTLAPESIRVNSVHPTGVKSGMTMNEAMMTLAVHAAEGGDNSISAMQNEYGNPLRKCKGRPSKERWLLSTIAVCGQRGFALGTGSVSKHGKPYYRCSSRPQMNHKCAMSIQARQFEEYVLGKVFERFPPPVWQRLQKGRRAAEVAPVVDVVALDADLALLAKDWGDGRISRGEWDAARSALLERMAQAETTLDEDLGDLPDDPTWRGWGEVSMETKRLVLTTVIDNVIVAPRGRIGVLVPAAERVEINWR